MCIRDRIPGTQAGNLGCASAVSIIFYRATGYALVGNSYVTLGTTQVYDYLNSESAKPNSSWEKITNWETDSKPGDIICTKRAGPDTAGHIGVVVIGDKIVSNSSGGFDGDQKGQIELNYSISNWKKNVYPRNPSETASFRYKGPYATTWGTVGSSQITLSTAERNNNQLKIKTFLKSQGLSQIEVAGVMGNIQKESNFNPTATNNKDLNGYSSYGLIQWNQKYVDKATVGDTVDTQLNYLITMSTYKKWLKETKTDADNAAWQFADIVEVCDKCNKTYEIYKTSYQYDRSKYAINFYNRMSNTSDPLYWG